MYWEGNEVCEYELAFFKNECDKYNGEFVDYQENSCQTRKLLVFIQPHLLMIKCI